MRWPILRGVWAQIRERRPEPHLHGRFVVAQREKVVEREVQLAVAVVNGQARPKIPGGQRRNGARDLKTDLERGSFRSGAVLERVRHGSQCVTADSWRPRGIGTLGFPTNCKRGGVIDIDRCAVKYQRDAAGSAVTSARMFKEAPSLIKSMVSPEFSVRISCCVAALISVNFVTDSGIVGGGGGGGGSVESMTSKVISTAAPGLPVPFAFADELARSV